MKLDFLKEMKDPYLSTAEGQGVFLSGVLLGALAIVQTPAGGTIDSAPIYKQLNFGRMQRRDVRSHIAKAVKLIDIYVKNIERDDAEAKSGTFGGIRKCSNLAEKLKAIAAEAGELLLSSGEKDLGINGNFVFSVAFLNADKYFWKLFKKAEEE